MARIMSDREVAVITLEAWDAWLNGLERIPEAQAGTAEGRLTLLERPCTSLGPQIDWRNAQMTPIDCFN